MKIVISGLQPDVDPELLRERMEHFGPVVSLEIIRDGNPDQPWALLEMALAAGEMSEVARRINGIFHIDRKIEAHVVNRG